MYRIPMKIYKPYDQEALSILEGISSKVRNLQQDEIPFFTLAKNDVPKGILAIQQEPCYFVAEAGSTLGEIACFNVNVQEFQDIIRTSIDLMKQEDFVYLIHFGGDLSEEEQDVLKANKFRLNDHYYMMGIEVSDFYDIPQGLLLKPITIEGRSQFLDVEKEYYEGTGDSSTESMMDMIRNMPSSDLDAIYNEDTSYYVMDGESIIAIVVIFIDRGGIASIAVRPDLRRKGYGRRVLHMAMNRLKEFGWSKIMLRVHADNEAALKLYKRTGFEILVERKAYVAFSRDMDERL
ncbi:MAG: GNAT family N-acetyltransferase [Candidatus Thorarchaeota archaeon]